MKVRINRNQLPEELQKYLRNSFEVEDNPKLAINELEYSFFLT